MLECLDELTFTIDAQVSLEHGRLVRLDGLDHPINSGVASEEEDGRLTRLQRPPDLADQIVIDSDIGQRAGYGTRPSTDTGADDSPGQRVENSRPIKVPHRAPVTAPDPAIIAVRFTD